MTCTKCHVKMERILQGGMPFPHHGGDDVRVINKPVADVAYCEGCHPLFE
ncbi:MAG: hypothetical protein HY681_14900 [Chloroflexi bacterium]|nr:hypothetical protein [Chloroflexota bacterium]